MDEEEHKEENGKRWNNTWLSHGFDCVNCKGLRNNKNGLCDMKKSEGVQIYSPCLLILINCQFKTMHEQVASHIEPITVWELDHA